MEPWFLSSTHFYDRISKEDLEVFRRVCPRRHHQKGSYVFRSGDPAIELHLLEEGQVKLVTFTPKGGVRILAVCGHADFIGEAFLREKNRYSVDAVALTEGATCPISRAQFLQLTEERATFALIFAEILADQLLYCRNQLGDSYGSVKLRVAKVLLQQTQHFGKSLEESSWYELITELTHDDIAAMVAVTRVAVSKAFSELRREGLVEGRRGRYRLNVPALESLISA
jgi:CRP/FNR family transcriptional regulator